MGVVYEAWDPLIERSVAIKVMRIEESNATRDAEVRHRFRREAQAAGKLAHPNIVAVYDYGEPDDKHSAFIAMELVVGRDLKSLFDAGRRFTVEDTRRLMHDLLAALQHAHERGVVHRDIKPGNVLLLDAGGLKVADFGIAKLETSDLTQTGAVIGTVSHMSPEQIEGKTVDRRSDLFSCGVILYQLLTGERPFTGSAATVMRQVLYEHPPSPSTRVTTLPSAVDAVVSKAMAKQPGDRYATASEFSAALDAALAGAHDSDSTIAMPTVSAQKHGVRRGALITGIAVTASVAALGTAWTLLSREAVVPVPAAPPAASAVQPEPVAAKAPDPPPAASQPAVVVQTPEEVEQLTWDDAVKANTVAAYGAYLKEYPKGRYVQRARVRIAALQPPPIAAKRVEPAASPPAPVPTPQVAAPAPAQAPAPAPPPAAFPGPAVAVAPTPASAPAPAAASAAKSPASRPTMAAVAPPTSAAAASRATPRSEPDCVAQAQRGDAACQVVLGNRYRIGKVVPRDYSAALSWYAKAAEQGSESAQYELGLMHERGEGVQKNAREAVALYRKAADRGHARAQNRLGLAYEDGTGLPINLVLAAQWYGKAAEQGLPAGQSNLGRMYLQGRGVFKDVARAAELLQRAADQGEPNAMYYLGWMAEKGEGRPRDAVEAARWYRQALAGTSLSERNRASASAFVSRPP
jgi:hypothetical protein